MNAVICKLSFRAFSSAPKICIVGSGPAGFFTASKLLKNNANLQIDIYEKLPVPFGLVRYGVAPDHPDVKLCIHSFTQAAENERVKFFGNVAVGKDITIAQLKNAYNAVILAYGAGKDKELDILGENLPNVISAKSIVGWYNGYPADRNLDINLRIKNALVIGQGNVSLDVSRILLSPVPGLMITDMPNYALKKLKTSLLKKLTIVGRRDPEHVAFSTKEFRELTKLQNCTGHFHPEDMEHISEILPSRGEIKGVSSKKKRLLQLILRTGENTDYNNKNLRIYSLKFRRTPIEILPNEDGSGIKGVVFSVNKLEDDKYIPTGETETINCELVVKSIGYTSAKIDEDIPFSEKLGVVPNENGRVIGDKNMYVCGWLGTGPVGVIAATMENGYLVAKNIINDIKNSITMEKSGREEILSILQKKGVQPVTFKQWSNLNEHEIFEGSKLGKPREKVTNFKEMINISKT